MYIFGGVTEKGLTNELYALDIERNMWTQIQTSGKGPIKRSFPCFWALESKAPDTLLDAWPMPMLERMGKETNHGQSHHLQVLSLKPLPPLHDFHVATVLGDGAAVVRRYSPQTPASQHVHNSNCCGSIL